MFLEEELVGTGGNNIISDTTITAVSEHSTSNDLATSDDEILSARVLNCRAADSTFTSSETPSNTTTLGLTTPTGSNNKNCKISVDEVTPSNTTSEDATLTDTLSSVIATTNDATMDLISNTEELADTPNSNSIK